MFGKMFAKLQRWVGKIQDRVCNTLEAKEAEIRQTREEICGSEGVKKHGLRMHLKAVSNKKKRLSKINDALTAIYETFNFMAKLCDSFSYQLVPTLALLILLAGRFEGVLAFVVGTLINTIMVFGVLCVIMYASHVRKYVPEIHLWNQKTQRICKAIFLAVTAIKVLYTVLTPVWTMLVVVIASVITGLYLARDELKVLLER